MGIIIEKTFDMSDVDCVMTWTGRELMEEKELDYIVEGCAGIIRRSGYNVIQKTKSFLVVKTTDNKYHIFDSDCAVGFTK